MEYINFIANHTRKVLHENVTANTKPISQSEA